MACRFWSVLLVLTALVAAPLARAQTAGDATGIWLTQAGDAKVRVSRCGGGICGVIVWLKESYESHVSVPGPDTLRVEGCVGMLCGGETWTRAGR